MTTLRVGQRVRVIYEDRRVFGKTGTVNHIAYDANWSHDRCAPYIKAPLVYVVDLDDYQQCGYLPGQIVPLTDPAADAFVERIKRLKPYEEPKVTRETAVLSGSSDKEKA